MRLANTKANRAQLRKVFTPKDAVRDARSSEAGEAFTYELAGALYALAFRGTAGKPAWHYRFKSVESREKSLADFFSKLQAVADWKAQRKAEVGEPHNVKVGDIFRSSWGYDQTNIDYYQVVALAGSTMAEVREIQCQSEATGWAQGDSVPAPGKWDEQADYSEAGKAFHAANGYYPRVPKPSFRVRLQMSNGEPHFKVASYANAYRMKPLAMIGDKPVFGASHWTAYA